jgi:hypothetical protein
MNSSGTIAKPSTSSVIGPKTFCAMASPPCDRLPRAGVSRSALDLVVNPSHHRLVHLDARRREDRQKGCPERLECLLGLPNVEDLDLAVGLKCDVGDASVGGSGTRFLQLLTLSAVVRVAGYCQPMSEESTTPDPFALVRGALDAVSSATSMLDGTAN